MLKQNKLFFTPRLGTSKPNEIGVVFPEFCSPSHRTALHMKICVCTQSCVDGQMANESVT